MKIIKKGVAKEWSTKDVCTGRGNKGVGCGAILLVGYSDLFKTTSHSYDGSSESYATFKCPQCLALTDLNPKPPRSYDLPDQKTHAANLLKKTAKDIATDNMYQVLQEYQRRNHMTNNDEVHLHEDTVRAMKAYLKFSS
jgi:hypothetical protein